MKRISLLYIPIVLSIIPGCSTRETKEPVNTEMHNAATYSYSNINPASLTTKKTVYVPIYTSIYLSDNDHTTNLTATLSIRSMSFKDSIFVSKIDYYNTEGRLIKTYIEKPLLIKPMQSVQFPVKDKDVKGMGANFVVEWGSLKQVRPPLIQAVMVGTQHQLGISFTTDGVNME